MEPGIIFALLAALSFAGSTVFIKRGVHHAGESFSGVFVSVFLGTLLFSFLMLFTGEWGKLWSLSGRGFALLGAAGIVHFVAGRFLSYTCFRLLGANRGVAIIRTNLFYAVAFGIIFLNEPFTAYLIVGVLCIAAGTILVSVEKGDKVTKVPRKGILTGLGGAFCWGISGVLAKPGIEEIGSPYPALFISYVAASVVIAGLLLDKGRREQLLQLRRQSIISFLISGTLTSVAQLFRYTALGYIPVSIVAPLLGISALFVFLFSFILNRKIEVFTWKVFVGIVAAVGGTFLLFR